MLNYSRTTKTQKSNCTMYTVPKLWQHKRVIAQCTRCQSYGNTKELLHNVHGAKAMATQKSDCTMYKVPKLWPHKRVIAQCTRVKAMATQKSDCTMYTLSKLWPHKRVIAQCTRCQSYGHTKEWLHNVHGTKAIAIQKSDCTMYTCQSYSHTKTYCSKPYNCVKSGGPNNSQVEKPKDTPSTRFLCNGRHPANYKDCMVYRDLVSAINRNNYMYERRRNIRTTLSKQQVSNNAQNNTWSYAQAVTGVPADATSNNDHNSTNITTQLTTFLSEFKNMFSPLVNQNSMILSMLSPVINKLT
jgi:hypothetical protein